MRLRLGTGRVGCEMAGNTDKRYCEVCCGIRELDGHDIRPKGMGGSKDPSIEAPQNKITLCRTCHRNIHDHRWLLQRTDQELKVCLSTRPLKKWRWQVVSWGNNFCYSLCAPPWWGRTGQVGRLQA